MARFAITLAAALVAAACSAGTAGPAATRPAAPAAGAGTSTTAPLVPSRPPFCDLQWEGRDVGRVTDPDLAEISGAALSRAHPGVIWVHNDSGNDPAVYALGLDGTLLGRVELPGLTARDWEDMAIGPGPGGGDYLYLADIGDNNAGRASVLVHRVPEPDPVDATQNGGDTLTITYPEGPAEAETLLVDSASGELVIVGKTLSGRTPVFIVPVDAPWGETASAVRSGDLSLGSFALATGGDADGERILIRTYDEVFLWERDPGESVAGALARPGCRVASVTDKQGEALALAPGETRFFVLSEGLDQPVLAFTPPG